MSQSSQTLMLVFNFLAFQRIFLLRAIVQPQLASRLAMGLIYISFVGTLGVAQERPVQPDHARNMKAGTELFIREVRELLTKHCLSCHGGESIKGGFDLSSREAMLDSGMVEPGDVEASQLISVVAHTSEPVMPKNADRLSSEAIASIAKWVELGAPFDSPLIDRTASGEKPSEVTSEDRQFWSFKPLKTPPVPFYPNEPWVTSPIDAFIWRQLSDNNIQPNEVTDRRRLIRRAYFDLIGLPPTPEDVNEFVQDTRPTRDAFEGVIDRLLKSPHFGERRARHWMDIARFAESHGYEQDYDRPNAYHYRDFLIKAFNDDLPFNQFVQWQIAGDEIAPDQPLAWAATGFLGAGAFPTQLTESEFESARYDELDDMVGTLGTAMLGLSIGCARCHTHKFDPIPVGDYYSLVANFATAIRSEKELDFEPEANRKRIEQFEVEHAELIRELAHYRQSELLNDVKRWLEVEYNSKVTSNDWTVLSNQQISSTGKTTFQKQPDESWLAQGIAPAKEIISISGVPAISTVSSVRVETLVDPSLPHQGPGRAGNGNFAIGDIRIHLIAVDGSEKEKVDIVSARATHQQNSDSLSVAASFDSDEISGWAVDGGGIGKDQAAVFEFKSGVALQPGESLRIDLYCQHPNGQHSPGKIRISYSEKVGLSAKVASEDDIRPEVHTALKQLQEDFRSDSQAFEGLLPFFEKTILPYRRRLADLAAFEKKGTGVVTKKVLVTSEGLPPLKHHADERGFPHFYPQTYVLARGDAHQKRGPASPGVLQVLTTPGKLVSDWQVPASENRSSDSITNSYRRSAVARWLTDVEHGAGALAARVFVNRVWQQHFGVGIVATPSDFGLQGDRPTHPELLEWLAEDFARNGWQVKRLHRMIMTSSAYMQSSLTDEQRSEVDRENKLLWRFPTRRLDAEVIRDSMLSVSGRLDVTMFGPGTLDSMMNRRSIYFFIKRSQLIPFMLLFDWPEHLVGIGQRATTTVAPQALALMNSPECHQCAQALADRVAAANADETVDKLYSIAFCRSPKDIERKLATGFLQSQMDRYSQGGAENPHRMALVDLCRTILSMNEMIYVD